MRVTVLFIYLILYLRHPRHQRKARAADRRVPRVIRLRAKVARPDAIEQAQQPSAYGVDERLRSFAAIDARDRAIGRPFDRIVVCGCAFVVCPLEAVDRVGMPADAFGDLWQVVEKKASKVPTFGRISSLAHV